MQERANVIHRYSKVMKELKSNVEELEPSASFNRFVQEECGMRNTHRRGSIEREFWEMSLDHKQWRCVETAEAHYQFFYADQGGIACRDTSNMQMIAV